jgi:hypothetical protein
VWWALAVILVVGTVTARTNDSNSSTVDVAPVAAAKVTN